MRVRRKITARTTALAVALGMVSVLAFSAPASAIGSISASPLLGPPGTPVTITGVGTSFTSGGVTVKFNGTSATFTVVNDTSITTSVPCGATDGAIAVTDTTDGSNSTASFDVTTAPAPVVSSFSPTAGTAGATSVTITGSNFCGATSVKFNATSQTTVSGITPTQVTATVPTGATTGKVSVTTPISTGTSAADFTVGPPVITSFSPTIGPVATTVVITGSNFLNVTSVKFNGLAAVFTVNSATQITTTVPTGATTGPLSVTNGVGTATGSTFTVGVPTHSRSVSFSYKGHRASGSVSVGDGFSACLAFVPVYIQQLRNGKWKLLDTTATNGAGGYNTWVPDKIGKFRAQVKKLNLAGGGSCSGDASPTRHHA